MNKLIQLTFFASIAVLAFNSCQRPVTTKQYLNTVLANLEKIQSASYRIKRESWAPGDTAASVRMLRYYKEYNNPEDTTIGASFVSLLQEDTTKMDFCYDGKMRVQVYDDEKFTGIDSFKIRELPFKPLTPPFFNYAKSIVRYAIETKDSVSIKLEELEKSFQLSLIVFEDKQVEFFGKAFYMEDKDNPLMFGDPTSKYEIWIDKTTNLPFKIRREMSHNISGETVKNVKLNKMSIRNFKPDSYFPKDYPLVNYGQSNPNKKESNLLGKKAPDWSLTDTAGKTLSLKDMQSKVVMIQFTSVSCGPCRASIPFLNELTSTYKKADFDFIAIECTANSMNAVRFYQTKTGINYKFLKSDKSVLKAYEIKSFPVFFILDKNRMIKYVINGYGKGSTEDEIRNIVDKMLK
jgi:Thiol-disulfide isomerase and thioredoxins